MSDSPEVAQDREVTLLEREREALSAAPSHDELVLRLRAVVKDELARGTSGAVIRRELDALRREQPEHSDVVLDVLDFLEGWSSPHVSLG